MASGTSGGRPILRLVTASAPDRPAIGLLALALVAGLAIAYVDSRPTSDSAGVTVFALVGIAGVIAFVARRRPWLWALLVGLPTPLAEVPQYHDASPIAAVAFAGVGAAIGWTLAEARRHLGSASG